MSGLGAAPAKLAARARSRRVLVLISSPARLAAAIGIDAIDGADGTTISEAESAIWKSCGRRRAPDERMTQNVAMERERGLKVRKVNVFEQRAVRFRRDYCSNTAMIAAETASTVKALESMIVSVGIGVAAPNAAWLARKIAGLREALRPLSPWTRRSASSIETCSVTNIGRTKVVSQR